MFDYEGAINQFIKLSKSESELSEALRIARNANKGRIAITLDSLVRERSLENELGGVLNELFTIEYDLINRWPKNVNVVCVKQGVIIRVEDKPHPETGLVREKLVVIDPEAENNGIAEGMDVNG